MERKCGRKGVALLLAAAMLLLLAACGGGAAPERSQQEAVQETAREEVPPTEQAQEDDAALTEQAPSEAEPGAENAGETPEAPEPTEDSAAGEADAADQTGEPVTEQLSDGEWMTPGEGIDADGRGPDELEENEPGEVEFEGQMLSQGITDEEFARFGVTVPDAAAKARGFRDFQETMNSSFLGTWYDPEAGEALRITEDGAYVYIPYLGCWAERLCRWELVDRSEQGKCPRLSIYCFGEDSGPLTYYVAGNTGEYFWCVSQGQLFYRQD